MKLPIHFADTRRADGTRWQYEQQRGQVKQYPVICAVDFVELIVSALSRREHVVTNNKRLVTCRDCKERL